MNYADPETAWQNGNSLWQSLFEFAEPNEAEEFRQLSARMREAPPTVTMLQSLNEYVQHIAKSGGSGNVNYLDSEKFKQASELSDAYNKMERKLQERVRHRLATGTLVAFGYVIPRGAADKPVRLPLDIWIGRIDWRKSSASGNGLEAVAIRTTEPNFAQTRLSDKQTGRPSRRNEIQDAFWRLVELDKINTGSIRANFEPIRQTVAELYPREKYQRVGLSDKVLYRELPPLIEQLKSSL